MFFLFKYWLTKRWHLRVPSASISVMPLCEFDIGLCPVLKNCCYLNIGDGLIAVFVPPLWQLVLPFNHISAVLVAVPHQWIVQEIVRGVFCYYPGFTGGNYDLISSLSISSFVF